MAINRSGSKQKKARVIDSMASSGELVDGPSPGPINKGILCCAVEAIQHCAFVFFQDFTKKFQSFAFVIVF
jgi:hypothetical protein